MKGCSHIEAYLRARVYEMKRTIKDERKHLHYEKKSKEEAEINEVVEKADEEAKKTEHQDA